MVKSKVIKAVIRRYSKTRKPKEPTTPGKLGVDPRGRVYDPLENIFEKLIKIYK